MSSPQIWKWCVALFDDNPDDVGVKATEKLLRDFGINVYVFGGEKSTPRRLDFLYEEEGSDKIRCSHLLLVDMQWDKPGLDSDLVQLPDLVRDRSSSLSDKLKNFVEKISQPCAGGNPFPNAPIPPRLRGFWVAAALSHLCPYSVICFFSGYEQVLNSPIAAAFSQFSRPAVKVIHKNATSGIEKNDFFDLMEQLQQDVFARSSEALEWLIGRVLLPILIGAPPLKGVSGKLWDGDHPNAEWTLEAEHFFPQWNEWREKDRLLKALSFYVAKPAFRLPQPKERALNSIKHDLKTILSDKTIKPSSLDRPIQTCFDVGYAVEGVLLRLQQAQENDNRSMLEQALKLCDSILENGLRQLDDLCLKYGGQFVCAERLERKPDSSRQVERDYFLPFDLTHFRRVIEALTDNAVTPNGGRAAVRLNSFWNGKCLYIEYVDNSMGFDKLHNPTEGAVFEDSTTELDHSGNEEKPVFADCVIKSIGERGVSRGLPLALTFPFFYPVQKMECLIGRKWAELFPMTKVDGEYCPDWRFGIRWAFDMPHPEEGLR